MKVIAIGTDPNESEGDVSSYRDREGLTYRIAVARTDIVSTYRITAQSSKVGVDKNGVVQVRSIYGRQGADWWQDTFNTLTQ